MSTGGYFVIGDIKGGNKYKKTLRALIETFKKEGSSTPFNILYLRAASHNKMKYKVSFEKGIMKNCADLSPHISSLNLGMETSLFSGHSHPEKIKKAFERADMIYIDGGDPLILKNVFERFDLNHYCKEAVRRGAIIGGLSAGGILADLFVYHSPENNEIQSIEGIGLISGRSISCHMDRQEEKEQRLKHLFACLSSGQSEKAIAIGTNQTTLFQGTHEYVVLPEDDDSRNPYYLTPENRPAQIQPFRNTSKQFQRHLTQI